MVAEDASLTVENSRLLQDLELKTRMLEESEARHRRLTDATLRRTGLDGLGTMLAEMLGRGLTVEQDVVAPFRRQYGQMKPHSSPAVSVPIMAAGEKLGRVCVDGSSPLDELGSRTLEHGATALAGELLKERSEQEVEWRLGGELLEELLKRSEPMDRRLTARAAKFGIDTTQKHRIAVFETTNDDIDLRTMHVAAAQVLASASRDLLLTVLGPGRAVLAVPPSLERRVESLIHSMAAAVGGCAVGLSRSTLDLPRGLREALASARFASFSGHPGAVLRADDLGAMRFLVALGSPVPLQDYINEQLGTLFTHDGGQYPLLLQTLRAFVETDGHHGAIAERCHIHKSTVKYRLARLGEILDRPLNHPEVRFELRLALALADVLSTLQMTTDYPYV